MKKKFLIGFMSFLSVTLFSQVFYNETSKNLRYAGGLTPQVFAMLDTQDRQLLFDCIAECGVDRDSVVWIQKNVYDNLDNPEFYHTKMVIKRTSSSHSISKVYDGLNSLEKPQFMVFIDRYKGETEITLQMYY